MLLTQVTSGAERRNDDYGQLHASGLHCHGRVVLNLWRLLRSELKLRIYTFESCVAAVLQLRTPHVPAWQLAQWFNNGPGGSSHPSQIWPFSKEIINNAFKHVNLTQLQRP